MSIDWGAAIGTGLGGLLGGPIGAFAGNWLGDQFTSGSKGTVSRGLDRTKKNVLDPYQQVGSASDVKLINSQNYNDYLKNLYGQMGGFSSALGQNAGNVQSILQGVMETGKGYQDILNNAYGQQGALNGQANGFFGSMYGAGGQASQNLSNMSGMTGNLNNYAKQLQAQGGMVGGLISNPAAATNQYLSMSPALAQLANQNVNGALSDVYSSGRAQAQGAADEARRQAANQLANAGLLNSGAAVQAMTKATAQPQLEMETNLANMRAQAYQNQLSGLQGQTANLLGSGYSNALQGGLQSSQLGLQANELAGNLYNNAASGYQNLASIYGQAGINSQNLAQQYAGLGLNAQQGLTGALAAGAQGYQNLGSMYGSLLGQSLGYGSTLNEPYYYVPQYMKNAGLGGLLGSAGQIATGVASILPLVM